MKHILSAVCGVAALAMAGQALAEQYKDYTPRKGAWQITEVHVDSNHIDDYLTGLRTTWVPSSEIAKKHGIIDDYAVLVRVDPAGHGANVLLTQHLTSLGNLEADKARDDAMQKEFYATLPKEKCEAMVAGYDKYRTFVGDGFYQVMDFAK
jgi:hypothetical protein